MRYTDCLKTLLRVSNHGYQRELLYLGKVAFGQSRMKNEKLKCLERLLIRAFSSGKRSLWTNLSCL